MMFSQKPTILVYVQRNNLLLEGRKASAAKLSLPESLIANLEVVDKPQLLELCRQFFENHNVRGQRALVVLDRAILFDKLLADKTAALPQAIDDFRSAVPLNPEQRATVSYRLQQKTAVFVTNRDIYQSISEALERAGAKLFGVTPAPAYGLPQQNPTKSELIAHFLDDKEVVNQANFSRSLNG